MNVVEKAGAMAQGGAPNPVAVDAKPREPIANGEFDIDFDTLKHLGYYHPGARDTRLARELRAIKRRLLRRIGFLRASGERQRFKTPGRQRNVVMLTSTRSGEGKTFCAVNLALNLALEDEIDVLLVDADVQRPKVRSQFGLAERPGVADRLTDPTLPVRDLFYRARQTSLSILGEGERLRRTSDVFNTPESQDLWAHLSAQSPDGLVIVDAPPVLATTEAVVLARFVDEVVFVVEAQSTPEPAVAAALDEILDVNPNVSLVLNRCLIGAGGSDYSSYEYYERSDADAQPSSSRGSRRGGSHAKRG